MIFFDIETVPAYGSFDKVPKVFQKLWEYKVRKREEDPKDIYPEAGLYPEFGKIVCISAGFIHKGDLRVKSFTGKEVDLLNGFAATVRGDTALCGHNIKGFDIPYVAKRMMINNISIPSCFDMRGKKPWEIPHYDTMEVWKFGGYEHTSLDLLTNILGIKSPKDDIKGSDVYKVFYKDNDIKRIAEYCEKDVLAVANVYQRLNGYDLIKKMITV